MTTIQVPIDWLGSPQGSDKIHGTVIGIDSQGRTTFVYHKLFDDPPSKTSTQTEHLFTAVAGSMGGSLFATDLPQSCGYIGNRLQSAVCVQLNEQGSPIFPPGFTVTRFGVVIDATVTVTDIASGSGGQTTPSLALSSSTSATPTASGSDTSHPSFAKLTRPGLSKGLIIGAVLGSVLGLIAVVCLIMILRRRRQNRRVHGLIGDLYMSMAADRSVGIGYSSHRPVPFVEPEPDPSTRIQTKKDTFASSVGTNTDGNVDRLGDSSTGSKQITSTSSTPSQSGVGSPTGTRINELALDEGEIPEDPDTLKEMVKELRRERRVLLTERSRRQFSDSQHTSDRRWSAGTRTTAPPGYEE